MRRTATTATTRGSSGSEEFAAGKRVCSSALPKLLAALALVALERGAGPAATHMCGVQSTAAVLGGALLVALPLQKQGRLVQTRQQVV